jgi:hypothetical protein
MDAETLKKHILDTFDGLNVMDSGGDTFYIYDPDGCLPPERMMPFITIVTADNYDTVSNLSEPGTYRLNVGLTKATFTARFSTDGDIDYAARNTVMPHPVYAPQHWICVVNPTRDTIERLGPLMTEAYDFAVRKYTNHRTRA